MRELESCGYFEIWKNTYVSSEDCHKGKEKIKWLNNK